MRNRERAQVWKYFHKEGEKSVVCGLCGQRLTFCSSTTTMRYHLERKHPMQWALGGNVREINVDTVGGEAVSTLVITEELDPTSSFSQDNDTKPKRRKKKSAENAVVQYDPQNAATSSQSNNSLRTVNGTRNTAINYFITEMLVRDLLPLKEVENMGFKQLINYLEPSFSIPTRELVLQSLSRLYNEVKPGIIQSMKQVDTISLTMDIWLSSTSQLFLTLTAYWVTDDWSLANRVLSTGTLEIGYSVEDLGTRVQDTLNDYGIDMEKVSAVVHSDTENWPSEIGGIPAVTCFAFTLQEAVKKALELPPVSRLITAARKLVGSVKHLSGSIVEMAMQKAEVKVSEIKIEQDVQSRWFTTCTMLKLLHEQRSILAAVLGHDVIETASGGVLTPDSEQWDTLGEIVRILHPLQTATEVISGEKNVSVSSVFPILHGLTTVHLSDHSEDSPTATLFKQVVRSEINCRWNLDSVEVVGTIPVIASVLDPRYRDPLYLNVEQRTNIKDSLMKVISSYPSNGSVSLRINSEHCMVEADTSVGAGTSKLNLSALEFLLGRHVMIEIPSSSSGNDATEAEFKLYMDPVMNPPAATDCNPFLWWQGNRLRFPNLANVAKRFLCIPATYTPTERLFSKDGMLFNSSRSQLEPDCVDFILFLNSNFTSKKK